MTRTQRVIVNLVGAVASVFAAYLLLMALLIGGFKCDESCSEDGNWWTTRDAWQWDGQLGLAFATSLGVVGTWALVAKGRPRAAAVPAVLAVCSFAVWLAMTQHAHTGF
jgi:hypothetical protein